MGVGVGGGGGGWGGGGWGGWGVGSRNRNASRDDYVETGDESFETRDESIEAGEKHNNLVLIYDNILEEALLEHKPPPLVSRAWNHLAKRERCKPRMLENEKKNMDPDCDLPIFNNLLLHQFRSILKLLSASPTTFSVLLIEYFPSPTKMNQKIKHRD